MATNRHKMIKKRKTKTKNNNFQAQNNKKIPQTHSEQIDKKQRLDRTTEIQTDIYEHSTQINHEKTQDNNRKSKCDDKLTHNYEKKETEQLQETKQQSRG